MHSTGSVKRVYNVTSWRGPVRGTVGCSAVFPQIRVTGLLSCCPMRSQQVSTLGDIPFPLERAATRCPLISPPVVRSGATTPLLRELAMIILSKLMFRLRSSLFCLLVLPVYLLVFFCSFPHFSVNCRIFRFFL